MKKNAIYLFSLLFIIISMTSCLKDSCDETRTFTEYEQIFVHPDQFRINPTFLEQRKMETTGKIYFYNDLIMINERHEGIHIIDNTDSSNPTRIGFLAIPGNVDVSIQNDIMYADSYVDLLTIDISDLQNPRLLCRDEEVFKVYSWVTERGYYIGLEATDRTVEIDCTDPNFGDQSFNRGGFVLWDSNVNAPTSNETAGSGGESTQSGQGGSFARFSVIQDHLYVISISELIAYNLEDPTKPRKTHTTDVNWNIETLFPYKNYLFIGGNNGMFIYDRTNPDIPVYVSEFIHARACDPVYVSNDIAYVTLRNGTFCQNFINQLDIIDVSSIEQPQLIESHDMDHPHGLSVQDDNIYICEGEHGLKVFENEENSNLKRIEHIKDIHAYDVIALGPDHLLIIGKDGLYQYDSSNPSDLKELSFISID